MSFLGLSPQSPLVVNFAVVTSATQIALGLNGILRPREALTLYGFSNSSAPVRDQPLIDSLMQLYGVRNVSLALSILAAWRFGDSKTLGWVILADSLVAIGDGVVQKKQTGSGEWRHWAFVPLMFGHVAVLLGCFD